MRPSPFRRGAHLALGETGERLACRHLRRRGYAILARRYRTRGGEIDIVARDGGALVFVEVKTRAGTRHGTPSEAVTAHKRRRLVRMAMLYLARHRIRDERVRFDVVAVTLTGAKGPFRRAHVELRQGAFTPDD